MDVTKPYKLIGFGAMDVTKTYEFVWFLLGGFLFTRGGVLIGSHEVRQQPHQKDPRERQTSAPKVLKVPSTEWYT